MKSLFAGLVLVAVALSVNASGIRLQHIHSDAPVCPPGEKAVPHVIDGKLVWECVPVS